MNDNFLGDNAHQWEEVPEHFDPQYSEQQWPRASTFINSQRSPSLMEDVFYPASIPLHSTTKEIKEVKRLEYWLGISATIVTLVGAAVATSWSINSSIDDKVNASRIELNSNIQQSKTELMTAMTSNQADQSARMDKLESKVDASSLALVKIQTLLEAKNNNK